MFLPREHGSWSLALEPVALGLLCAPTPSGLSLAAALACAFLMRRPLRAAGSRGAGAALAAAGMLAFLALCGLLCAVVLGQRGFAWMLLPSAILSALFALLDRVGESRQVAAELAGAAAFALVPAAFARAAGWDFGRAAALALVMAARTVPTLLCVRRVIRDRKGGAGGSRLLPLAASVTALALVGSLHARGLAPLAVVPLAAGHILFAGLLLNPAWVPWPARRIGAAEALFGVFYVACAAWGYRAS